MPNLADAVLEAGGKVYGRAAATDKFGEALSVDTSGYVTLGTGLKGAKVGTDYVAEAVSAGMKIACGEAAFDGSNPTSVATGLTTVVSVQATLKGTAAPGDNTSIITTNINGTSVDYYAWKNTGGTDPTLVASTGTESFYWFAVGT